MMEKEWVFSAFFLMLLISFLFEKKHSIRFSLDDVGAERAIERSIREAREQIDKGAADCKFLICDFLYINNNRILYFSTLSAT